MTTLPTSTYGLGNCNLCGHQAQLIHDGKGFLICEDATGCVERGKQLDQAEYADLKAEAKRLTARLSVVVRRMGELEKESGLYGLVVEKNRAELKRIEESGS